LRLHAAIDEISEDTAELRHEYDGVDPCRVWTTIRDSLPPLRAARLSALDTLSR
jgi:uncharacterized protein with HEPN domain